MFLILRWGNLSSYIINATPHNTAPIMKQSEIAITIDCWATYLYSTDRLRILPPCTPRPAFNPIPCKAETIFMPSGLSNSERYYVFALNLS
ncbi:MAG: hypothetical protein A4E53_00671 [Pelotomaculum sp. PtaB.Bin104]|nr:MAG: hypothetical protein A4E53_00671 [Pelotomaculum sp. PtaB.Bin104]